MPDEIKLEEKYGPLNFEKHLKSIKTKERMVDCKYCNKEYVVDVPVAKRTTNEIVGSYSCPYCNQYNVVTVDDPIITSLVTEKGGTKEYQKFEGRRKLISVKVTIKKGGIP